MSDYQPGVGPTPGRQQPPAEAAGERLEAAGAQAGQTAREVGQRARTVGYQLYRGAERARQLAADGLSRAAGTLRGSTAEENSTARRFADSLESGATYLRHTDLAGMQNDAANLVKRYPAQALGAAFVLGVLIGQRYSRR